MISIEEFQHEAAEWLASNRHHAPRDYGAICPPDLVDAGLVWQRRLTEAGWAGIHWPVEHGGQGLPHLIAVAVQELWNGADMAFHLCPMLTSGVVEALVHQGLWEFEYVPFLQELRRPLFVIAGVHDRTSYPEQVEWLADLGGADVTVLDAGHYPWLDDEDAFAQALEDALTR